MGKVASCDSMGNVTAIFADRFRSWASQANGGRMAAYTWDAFGPWLLLTARSDCRSPRYANRRAAHHTY